MTEECPQLVAKWEEKGNAYIATIEPRETWFDHVNVRVITQGRVHIGMDVPQGKSQEDTCRHDIIAKEIVRRRVTPLPTFDACQ